RPREPLFRVVRGVAMRFRRVPKWRRARESVATRRCYHVPSTGRGTMQDEHFRSALRRDGFDEIDRRKLEPGTVVAEHAHPFDVRALVVDGEITLTIEGVDYAYREGDIFVVPAGHRHAEAVGPAGVDYLVGRRHAAVRPPNQAEAG